MASQKEEHLSHVVRRKGGELLRQPGVTSVGVGYRMKDGKATDEMVIQVTVERKLAPDALDEAGVTPLPRSIKDDQGNEIPIDVVERTFKPAVEVIAPSAVLDVRQQRRSRLDPIRPGISICHCKGKAGTLGAIVYDADGTPFALSNWHVLQGEKGHIGDNVIQPGAFDGGLVDSDVVGVLAKSHLGLAGDCAIASIEGRAFEPSIFELDVTPRRIGKVNLGDRVVKSGRTTGLTYGVVRRVSVMVNLNYGGDVGPVTIGGFEIGSNPQRPAEGGEISMPGDSGSLWLIDDPGENADIAVGLHFAGEADPDPAQEHALACYIHSVLQKLGVTLERPRARRAAITQLHEALGYKPAARDTREAVDEAPAAAEPPPLERGDLAELLEEFELDPDGVTAELNEAWGSQHTPEQARTILVRAQSAVANPERARAVLRAEFAMESVAELPMGFTFPAMDLSEIDIRPEERKFEPEADWLSWALFAGPRRFFPPDPAPFRPPADAPFVLDEPGAASPLQVALFSDFGTGLYYSRYIAKQFREKEYPYLFHLGDVYYAGRESEFRDQFESPLTPALARSRLFMLNSNHEMMSGAQPYYAFIDKKRAAFPAMQQQQSSMFCLQSQRFQITGIDTAYVKHGRFLNPDGVDVRTWLRNRLAEGRIAGRVNILLSADHPYKYSDDDHTDLLEKDLREFLPDVDLWFWGNTHYAALFGPAGNLPFAGCCVGHGGFPYGRQLAGKKIPDDTQLWFLEKAARFPARFNLRPDRGNNGYCLLELHADGTLGLRFIDWMSRERCTVKLARGNGGRLERTFFVEHADE